MSAVYRRPVAAWILTRRAALVAALAGSAGGCTSIDPGTNFVVPNSTFDPDYFYCHVEPQYLVAYKCGPGDASDNNSCHFNSAAVSGMALINHPAVNCGGGDHPVDLSQIGTGSAAQSNYQAASLEMSADYMNAPIFVRPSGNSHPRQVVMSSDDSTVLGILAKWANTQ
jgi:hypothetical protein